MEMYQKIGLLNVLKKHMGQNSDFIVEEGPKSKDEDQDGEATSLASKDQARMA